jgi:hypothetical protein
MQSIHTNPNNPALEKKLKRRIGMWYEKPCGCEEE